MVTYEHPCVEGDLLLAVGHGAHDSRLLAPGNSLVRFRGEGLKVARRE
jgi:hypothetical protein